MEIVIQMKSGLKIWIRLMEAGRKLGCHQMPDRSFFFKGYQFPVCARCTGVILGEIIAIVVLIFVRIYYWIALLCLIPMGIDWGIQYLEILKSDNIRRVITGTIAGFGLTHIYFYIIIAIINFLKNLFV